MSILRTTRSIALPLLLLAAALALAACGEDGDDAGEGDAADTPEAIVGALRENAGAFEYKIGEPGGTITSSTIGEPLTFNLALSNDAYSSGPAEPALRGPDRDLVADRRGRALAGRVLGALGGRADLDLLPAPRCRLARRPAVHRARRGVHLQSHHLQRGHPGQLPRRVHLPLPRGRRVGRGHDDRDGGGRLHRPGGAADAVRALHPLDGHGDLPAPHPRAARRGRDVQLRLGRRCGPERR